jgi:photosystem II stability/assembly factor-like uncharacterized protein
MPRNRILFLILTLSFFTLSCGLTSKETTPDDIQKTTLYAATADGLAIGNQGGKRWENIHSSRKKGILADDINDFAIGDSLTIAGTNKGILISTSNMQQWSSQSLNQFGSPEVNGVLVDGDLIYLATSQGSLTSTNNAKTWSPSRNKVPLRKIIITSQGLLAISDSELWISTDNVSNARVWSKKGINAKQINDIDARDNVIVIATNAGILISTNDVKSFGLLNESNGLLKNETTAVFIDEQNSLYAGNELGFNVSRDLGKSWNKFDRTDGLEMKIINNIYVKGNFYFLATDSGVYASFDKGNKWQKFDRSNGLRSNNVRKVFAR